MGIVRTRSRRQRKTRRQSQRSKSRRLRQRGGYTPIPKYVPAFGESAGPSTAFSAAPSAASLAVAANVANKFGNSERDYLGRKIGPKGELVLPTKAPAPAQAPLTEAQRNAGAAYAASLGDW